MDVIKRKAKILRVLIFVLLAALCMVIVQQYKNVSLIIPNIIHRMQMHIHYVLLPKVLLRNCDKKGLKYPRICQLVLANAKMLHLNFCFNKN